MEQQYNYDDIRCYYDEDVKEQMPKLTESPEILGYLKKALPEVDTDAIRETLRGCNTIYDFQSRVIMKLLNVLAAKTCTSLSSEDIDIVDYEKGHVFITNHRDIVLDSAFLNTLLANAGHTSCEIAIGNNLFATPAIECLVRMNKSFVVRRDLTGRQMLEASKKMSTYIHREVHEKNLSVWIAQREGRSKDNTNLTQSSVIKMLAMGGPSRDIIQNIRNLNVHPVAISYELDPCDYLKAAEFQLKRDDPEWKKSKHDDVVSMGTGMVGRKGRVVYTFTKSLNEILDTYPWIDDKTAQVNCICNLIDRAIHGAMHLFPINYVAYDIKYQVDKYSSMYTEKEKVEALDYLNKQLAKIDIPNKDEAFLWDTMLTMYSNLVVAKENLEKQEDEVIPLT